MKEHVLQLIERYDAFAGIAFLHRQADPQAAAEAFRDVMMHLYWEKRDLPLSIAVGRAGVQYALAEADRLPELDAAGEKLRGEAKVIAYNVASFAWPGWDEPEIIVCATDLALGYDAAKLNQRLTGELQLGPLAQSRAHWLIGAHLLCRQQLDDAEAEFQSAARLANEAGNRPEALLCLGYVYLTRLMMDPQDTSPLDLIVQVENALATLDHGPQFVEQLSTARKVFCEGDPAAEEV